MHLWKKHVWIDAKHWLHTGQPTVIGLQEWSDSKPLDICHQSFDKTAFVWITQNSYKFILYMYLSPSSKQSSHLICVVSTTWCMFHVGSSTLGPWLLATQRPIEKLIINQSNLHFPSIMQLLSFHIRLKSYSTECKFLVYGHSLILVLPTGGAAYDPWHWQFTMSSWELVSDQTWNFLL